MLLPSPILVQEGGICVGFTDFLYILCYGEYSRVIAKEMPEKWANKGYNRAVKKYTFLPLLDNKKRANH